MAYSSRVVLQYIGNQYNQKKISINFIFVKRELLVEVSPKPHCDLASNPCEASIVDTQRMASPLKSEAIGTMTAAEIDPADPGMAGHPASAIPQSSAGFLDVGWPADNCHADD